MNENEDLWCCGICCEVRQGNSGLLPVIDTDGWRHITCPQCREECPELVIAEDGEMWADYSPPLLDNEHLPFCLADWLDRDR